MAWDMSQIGQAHLASAKIPHEAITAAWRDGLIPAAERRGLNPKELYAAAIKRPDLKPARGTRPLRPVNRDHRRVGLSAGSRPLLTRSQAEAARARAQVIGPDATAKELAITVSCLYVTWQRLNIPRPGWRTRSYPHPRARKISRSQAKAAAARARVVGTLQAAAEISADPTTLNRAWRRHGLSGPGRGFRARP
jgi:hypothetical protein